MLCTLKTFSRPSEFWFLYLALNLIWHLNYQWKPEWNSNVIKLISVWLLTWRLCWVIFKLLEGSFFLERIFHVPCNPIDSRSVEKTTLQLSRSGCFIPTQHLWLECIYFLYSTFHNPIPTRVSKNPEKFKS